MNPLMQFTVKPLVTLDVLGFDVVMTNSALFMVLSALLGSFILYALVRPQRELPRTGQAVVEALYSFIVATARDSIGKGYKPYVPFIFSVFVMIFMGNF